MSVSGGQPDDRRAGAMRGLVVVLLVLLLAPVRRRG